MDRKCTDLWCLIVFVAFIVASFGTVIYSIKKGNPGLLLAPIDRSGNFCGHLNNNG